VPSSTFPNCCAIFHFSKSLCHLPLFEIIVASFTSRNRGAISHFL
jgi:hypothetical protein